MFLLQKASKKAKVLAEKIIASESLFKDVENEDEAEILDAGKAVKTKLWKNPYAVVYK